MWDVLTWLGWVGVGLIVVALLLLGVAALACASMQRYDPAKGDEKGDDDAR